MNIVCLDGYVYNQSNYLWLLLIVVAFVENDDSRHVHGELDYFEGLQYTLSNFRELDVVANYTVWLFVSLHECRLSYKTIWTMYQKK